MVIRGFLAKPPFTNQLGHKEQMERLTRQLEELQAALTPEVSAGHRRAVPSRRSPRPRTTGVCAGITARCSPRTSSSTTPRSSSTGSCRSSCRTRTCPTIRSASVLRTKGDLTGAIAEYEKLLAIKPTSGSAYYYLGWCHNKLGRADLAADLFRKAIRLEPDSIPAYLDLAELLLQEQATPGSREGLPGGPRRRPELRPPARQPRPAADPNGQPPGGRGRGPQGPGTRPRLARDPPARRNPPGPGSGSLTRNVSCGP